MKNIIKPLFGTGKDIKYDICNQDIVIEWGSTKFIIRRELLDKILNDYFIDKDKWYTLGASEDNPIQGGLGEYIRDNSTGLCDSKLTPRHASAIASIMCEEGMLTFKGKKPIMLKRI